jgi:hypothetical protein
MVLGIRERNYYTVWNKGIPNSPLIGRKHPLSLKPRFPQANFITARNGGKFIPNA